MPQDLTGPLSGMTRVSVSNLDAIVRNFRAKDLAYQKTVEAYVTAFGNRAYQLLYARTPVWLGNMQELLTLRFTAKRTGWEVGWVRADFLERGLRWYVPYVLFGTSRMPARPIHLEVEAIVRPEFRRALADALRETTERR